MEEERFIILRDVRIISLVFNSGVETLYALCVKEDGSYGIRYCRTSVVGNISDEGWPAPKSPYFAGGR